QGGGAPIVLHLSRLDAQQTRRLAGVRGEQQVSRCLYGAGGQQDERIGSPHLGARAGGDRRQQAAPPGALPQPRADHQLVGPLQQRQQLVGRGQTGGHDLGTPGQNRGGIFRTDRKSV